MGETFQCWYTIPDLPEDETVVNDGPIPWATRNQVSFVAEQVSHHPPSKLKIKALINFYFFKFLSKFLHFTPNIITNEYKLVVMCGQNQSFLVYQ